MHTTPTGARCPDTVQRSANHRVKIHDRHGFTVLLYLAGETVSDDLPPELHDEGPKTDAICGAKGPRSTSYPQHVVDMGVGAVDKWNTCNNFLTWSENFLMMRMYRGRGRVEMRAGGFTIRFEAKHDLHER